MKYVDDETKEIKWYNANICYSGTLIIVLINVLAFLWGGNDWVPHYVKSSWADVLDFNNIVVCFLSSFEHSNWQHCLLNCLCFIDNIVCNCDCYDYKDVVKNDQARLRR